MSDQPRIGALAPWFGGKRTLAPDIVEQVCWDPARRRPRTPTLFAEPFCGSMAVSLAMPDVRTHIVNDLNRDLVNFAMVLASDHGEALVARCERTLCSEDVFLAAVRAMGEVSDPVTRAWAFAVTSWLGPNGLVGTEHDPRFCKRYTPGGGDPATRWRSVCSSLPGFIERLRRFSILCEDGVDLVGRVSGDGAALYVDPPYLRGTRSAGSYKHDFSDRGGAGLFGEADDHDRLAVALNEAASKGVRCVVSYEPHERLEGLYPRPLWSRLERAGSKNTASASGAPAETTELLLVSHGAAPAGEGWRVA